MVERRRLGMMARLVEIQRAKRFAAEAALAEARVRERAARSAEEEARDGSRLAEEQWVEHLTRPGFSPEYARGLSGRLVDCHRLAETAGERARAALQAMADRQQDWQVLAARVRAGETIVRRLVRKHGRRAEEKRLEALADRVTGCWRRR